MECNSCSECKKQVMKGAQGSINDGHQRAGEQMSEGLHNRKSLVKWTKVSEEAFGI